MDSKEAAFLAKLRATFKIEAEEHLKNLNKELLNLEKCQSDLPPQDLLESIFREAHSLKGAARSVNHDVIQLICQTMENVLSALRQKRIKSSPNMFDTLYSTVDLIGKLLEENVDPKSKNMLTLMIQKLDALLNTVSEEPENQTKDISTSNTSPPSSLTSIPEGEKTTPILSTTEIEKTASLLSIRAFKKNSKSIPEVEDSPSLPPKPEIEKSESNSEKKPSFSDGPPQASERTIRVSLNKLDSLFQQAEELLTVKLTSQQQLYELKKMEKSLRQWQKEFLLIEGDIQQYLVKNVAPQKIDENKMPVFFERHHTFVKYLRENLSGLIKSTSQDYRLMGSMVDSLLDDAKKLLMQPFSTLLETFPRMVRDLSHQLKKDVKFEIQGDNIEIDRRILEEMKDPLIHMIRNCLDHGIESAEIRKQKNKPPTGTIRVSAAQLSGNSVEIVVSDDGQGILHEMVKATAVKQKVITQKEADTLTEDEATRLIFHSGVSTSQIVTELSGRGLGMGIVAERVDKLGGQLSISTKPTGTSIRMVLPLTLATFRGIHLKAADQIFIMPTHNVKRVVRIWSEEIKSVENRMTISIDGKALSYVPLKDVLGISTPNPIEQSSSWLTVLIVKAGEQVVAFGVDEVLNEQEVLVKRFGKQLTRVRNILSATIMEMGKVVPILNPSDLVKSIMGGSFMQSGPSNNGAQSKEIKRIILAEDSVTTRILLKNILESAGFDVTVAVDGLEALKLLREKKFDLLLTDIEMPNMNGFELTENVRQSESLKNLPVILCTSLTSQEDREHGVEVGANAYMDKSSFTQSLLLDIIEKLL